MTTEDKSKIVAQFNNYEFYNDDPEAYPNGYYCNSEGCGNNCIEAKDFEYHSNWNWLMPVWFKFRKLESTFISLIDELQFSEYSEYIQRAICQNETPSEAFEGIVKGIEWYNSIKK